MKLQILDFKAYEVKESGKLTGGAILCFDPFDHDPFNTFGDCYESGDTIPDAGYSECITISIDCEVWNSDLIP